MEQVPKDVVRQRCVVILPFPFSDLRRQKARPAIIVSNDRYNRRSSDVVAVPLTSNPRPTEYGLWVTNKNMENGELIMDSIARVDKVFGVEKRIIVRRIGQVDRETHSAMRKLLAALTK